jgi:uncharacterized protein YukE
MADIRIDYDKVSQTSTALKAGKEYLEDQLNQTSGEIRGLTQQAGGFRTQLASEAFFNSFSKWRDGMLRMVGGLDGMSRQLDTVVQEHQQLDQNLGGSAGS